MTGSQERMNGAEAIQFELCWLSIPRNRVLLAVGDRRSRSGCVHAVSVPKGCCTVFDTGPQEVNSASFAS